MTLNTLIKKYVSRFNINKNLSLLNGRCFVNRRLSVSNFYRNLNQLQSVGGPILLMLGDKILMDICARSSVCVSEREREIKENEMN